MLDLVLDRSANKHTTYIYILFLYLFYNSDGLKKKTDEAIYEWKI